jgi:hypothetical protein
MRAPRTIPLRETPAAAPEGARIIDASFEIVTRRRGLLSRVWIMGVAIFWAALIGFLIPPAWLLIERLLGG